MLGSCCWLLPTRKFNKEFNFVQPKPALQTHAFLLRSEWISSAVWEPDCRSSPVYMNPSSDFSYCCGGHSSTAVIIAQSVCAKLCSELCHAAYIFNYFSKASCICRLGFFGKRTHLPSQLKNLFIGDVLCSPRISSSAGFWNPAITVLETAS